jgi:hypothetical protein
MKIGIKATGPDGSYRRSDFGRGLVYLVVVWSVVFLTYDMYVGCCAGQDPRAHVLSHATMYVTLLFLVMGLALATGVLSGNPSLPRALRLLNENPAADPESHSPT